LQARFFDRSAIDVPVRLVLAACALVVLLHPDETVAAIVSAPVLLMIGYWVLRCRIAAPAEKPEAVRQPA
jgi:ABC-type bacteriocin/lantibiotic exporter with double-glycine peptidase domain